MWMYKGSEVDETLVLDHARFVYLITDLVTGKMYIGKKFVWSRRKVKGKTRRQKIESNWKTYFSSNNTIKKIGKETPERFSREILVLCNSEAETNFKEVVEIIKRDALWRPDYMNDNLSGKYFRKNVERYFGQEISAITETKQVERCSDTSDQEVVDTSPTTHQVSPTKSSSESEICCC